MDIKNLGINKGRSERIGAQASVAAGKGARSGAAPTSTAPSNGESLELTAIAQAFSAAHADAAIPPFDASRVQEIRDAIADGRYPIDNHRLADKLLELEGLLN